MNESSRKWLTVREFLAAHQDEAGRNLIGRNALYERAKDGSLPSIKLGKKVLIPEDALERLLEVRGAIRGFK